jgi:hypothetical protein
LEDLLRSALRGPDGVLARAAVAGAVAALRSGEPRPVVDGDAGQIDAGQIAAEILAALLDEPAPAPESVGPGRSTSAAPIRPAATTPRITEAASVLDDLAEAFVEDIVVARYLGSAKIRADTAAGTWTALWLACLRLPEDAAGLWRQRALAVREAAGVAAEPVWHELPGSGEVLVEPAPVFGATGLRESPAATPPPDVDRLLPATSQYAAMRVVAGQVRVLADRDPTLAHALESRRQTGFHPLRDPANLADLRRDLTYRLDDLAAATPGSSKALFALWRVDEVICSVVHVPPAHPQSWWGRLAERSHQVLVGAVRELHSAGEDVGIRVPQHGDFGAQREILGPHNVACAVAALPDSEVLACLRVWLRVGGETHLGRVVFVRNDG